ncbi:MAG: RNB domain-containing ribonuclease [Aphanocapsa sp. GSE-SYN-MK-11-07L]|jgi:ribonuclease R|nr:RNB domain-containing ribonuclease [Aphanocapsa sp. GSE-SYN-MK-11-07L]
MTTLRFPPQAIALAKTLTLQVTLWQRPQVQGITIDGPDSRDLDDAIWIESTATGAILSVHIADVSEIVTPNSVFDKVAIARTQTRYFKTGNAPMLPRALSEDKLSLLEYQDRPTLTVRVTLDQKAQIKNTEIFESWLRSSKRFTYQEAEAAHTDSIFGEMLSHAQSWAERLYQQRLADGAIGGRITQFGGWLNEEGNLVSGKRTNSHLLIQEFMILANRAAAHWLAEQDTPALYRNHTARAIAPDRELMYQTLLSLGSVSAIRQRLQGWLNRADYGPTLVGHFALNLPAYCHFTSPIRRLADLINHRIVKASLRGEASPYTKTELEQLGQHIAQVTLDIEQATSDYYKAEHQKLYQSNLQDADQLQGLDAKEFSRVLKYGIENKELGAIELELTTRLEFGKLPVKDLHLLIFETQNQLLREKVYAYLVQNISDATGVIAIASAQQSDWESFDYVEMSQISPFVTWLEVRVNGEVQTTIQPGQHQRKQSARHLACLMWIEAYIQDALVSPLQRTQTAVAAGVEGTQEDSKVEQSACEIEQKEMMLPPLTAKPKPVHPILTKTLKDGQNFISLLGELCQGLRWASPEYKFVDADDGFVCECKLEALNEQFVGEGIAPRKQLAKHRAARAVLEQLQGKIVSSF